MSGNQQFFGKKISLEANDAELKEVFKFLSDESGINLVLSDDVKGRVSILLKQVPWDQALVVIMQAKKLGYVRQGQILRISKLADLKQEEDDFSKLAKARQNMLPLTVKMVPISYAKVDDIVKQIKPFLSDRGQAIAETRTSSVVISDNLEVIERVQKLILSLDTPPAQVLIEGKIVEARDTFQRFIGVNWNTGGDTIDIGANSKGGKMSMNAGQFSFNPLSGGGDIAKLNFSITALDFLGDLNGALGLGETTGEVKVLSSPRVLTLHNEPAEITQTSSIPYVTSVPGPNGTSIPSAAFKDVTLKLQTTPQVTNDASVILSVDMTREFAGTVASAGAPPPTERRQAKTKVIVRNGQTAVIGGIYSSDSSEQESGLPGLRNIPVLGWLFKNKSNSRNKNELLIFLTPRIIGQADGGAAVTGVPVVAPGPAVAPAPQSSPATSGKGNDEGLDL
jgi:type IV pilus assembly protein PilQ